MSKLLFYLIVFLFFVFAYPFLQYNLLPIVLGSLVVATFLAYIPVPVYWIISAGIVAELMATSSPGVLLLGMLVPVAVRRLTVASILPTISFRFLGIISSSTALGVGLVIASNTWRYGIAALPWPVSVYQLVGTTLAAFIVTSAWHEYFYEPIHF